LRSPQAYAAALDYARRLHAVRPLVVERDALAGTVAAGRSGWAELITQRVPPHDAAALSRAIVAMAWTWRQLHDTLAERDRLDAHELQRRIDRQRERLREVTKSLSMPGHGAGNSSGCRQSLDPSGVGWLAGYDQTTRFIPAAWTDVRTSALGSAEVDEAVCRGGTGLDHADFDHGREL
jgi:hypothetical protein